MVRYGALPTNPVRDVARLEGGKVPARALDLDELRDVLGKLDQDEIAARHDLPDLARWYAGTGERTGEGLAVHWHHLDLDAGTVALCRKLQVVPVAAINTFRYTMAGRDETRGPVEDVT